MLLVFSGFLGAQEYGEENTGSEGMQENQNYSGVDAGPVDHPFDGTYDSSDRISGTRGGGDQGGMQAAPGRLNRNQGENGRRQRGEGRSAQRGEGRRAGLGNNGEGRWQRRESGSQGQSQGRQWGAGQGQSGGRGSPFGNISEQERNEWRERMQSMSREERMTLMRSIRNMSEEERNKLLNASPEERMAWFREHQQGGGAMEGGQGSGMRQGGRRGVDVPEEYRDLVENSPFMSVEYRASIERSGRTRVRNIQFTGISRIEGTWLFGLEERQQNRTYWLSEGDREDGIQILNFDETQKALTVSLNGIEMVLRISNE